MTEPTTAQLLALYQDAQFLTNSYISIDLVRMDERSKNIVVLAGQSLQIEIYPNGRRAIR